MTSPYLRNITIMRTERKSANFLSSLSGGTNTDGEVQYMEGPDSVPHLTYATSSIQGHHKPKKRCARLLCFLFCGSMGVTLSQITLAGGSYLPVLLAAELLIGISLYTGINAIRDSNVWMRALLLAGILPVTFYLIDNMRRILIEFR